MTSDALNESDLAALRAFDTPTICNALELAVPERRGHGYTISPLVCARPDLPPIVGYAKTCAVRAMRPPEGSKAEIAALRIGYYEYLEQGAMPTVSVVQDLDSHPGYGSFWGEVNSNIHKGLGCIGTITNGCIRDIDMIAEGFQMLAGMVCPSHAWTHVEYFGRTVNVQGMTVRGGDLVHADRHGAVVIPHEAAKEIPKAADVLIRREAVILEAAKKPGFTAKDLAKAMGQAQDIH